MAKSSAKYTLLPSEDEPLLNPTSDDEDTQSDSERTAVESPGEHPADDEDGASFPPVVDPRFVQTPPAAWKRAGLLFLILFCFWLAFQIKGHRATPQVVHAHRYSKEFKYRPAASPIVTEMLKDGRIRVRGAAPTSSATPTPTPTKPKTKKRSVKKRGTKKVAKKGKGGKTK
ncbi:hypothetical protein B0H19DRAFT_1266680 [Mycena capillaripes]|nr:hypothetical protein B0H19DRAFT_1266680 [Mycena capillaripes]